MQEWSRSGKEVLMKRRRFILGALLAACIAVAVSGATGTWLVSPTTRIDPIFRAGDPPICLTVMNTSLQRAMLELSDGSIEGIYPACSMTLLGGWTSAQMKWWPLSGYGGRAAGEWETVNGPVRGTVLRMNGTWWVDTGELNETATIYVCRMNTTPRVFLVVRNSTILPVELHYRLAGVGWMMRAIGPQASTVVMGAVEMAYVEHAKTVDVPAQGTYTLIHL